MQDNKSEPNLRVPILSLFVIIIMLLALLSNSSPNLSEDECDLLYGQGCICNMSQVLLDIESILQSPVGIKFANEVMSDVSIRIVQYKCSAFKPLPRGFDITLLTTPSRVGGMLNDTDKLSMSSEQFNKAIFEYTLIENANVVYAFPGSDYRFSCIVGSKEFLKDIVDSVNYVWNFNKKTNLTTSANVVYAFPGSDYRFSCIVGSKEFLKDEYTLIENGECLAHCISKKFPGIH
ncbi:uncharacterized protein LOC113467736 [Diaphorina citri]|uniref:Uncharacterized protein LOC113467736 n=1 Tax=Diaphorina citri TaxID=121845 RepID=A0A3Q0IUF0_DIACI|nr:uncharacterized protein LOC113467736 [Diaphorina citri]